MQCPNPHCQNGYIVRPVLIAESQTIEALIMSMGVRLATIEPCQDCIGGVASCCDAAGSTDNTQ